MSIKLDMTQPELVSAANQLKLTAPDGEKRLTDCLPPDAEEQSEDHT